MTSSIFGNWDGICFGLDLYILYTSSNFPIKIQNNDYDYYYYYTAYKVFLPMRTFDEADLSFCRRICM